MTRLMAAPAPPAREGYAICRRLAMRRRRHRIAIKALAATIAVSPSAIQKWECGERSPTLTHAILWARALGADIEMHGA